MNLPTANFARFLGPMPGRREAHALARLSLAAGVILCGISIALGFVGRTFLGRPLGGDFVEFYSIGRILNHYPPARIYDLELATRLQHSVLPSMPQTQMLVFAQAPCIAFLFRPFALLPYAWAYVAWLGFSAALYLAGLALLFRAVGLNEEDRKTGYLLALSMTPFLFETWIGGQVPVVAFFLWSLFFWCLERDRKFAAGFVLALCLFKPTLVAIPALMLLLGRRWRTVGGFAAGAAAMAALSLAAVGAAGCRAWIATLATDGKTVAGAGEAWHLAKYVDILALGHLLLAPWPAVATSASVIAGAASIIPLAMAWLRGADTHDRTLWAATLCWMLVINAYVPIYDSILLVCAATLAASVRHLPAGWLLALYMIPWFTQSFAEFLHVQLFTLAILGFGFWLLEVSRNLSFRRFRQRGEESTMTAPLPLPATGRFQVRSRGLL
jgi:alpha-1,2-mannosyltransferase